MHNEKRVCADFSDDIVLFLIGMRINRYWAIHKWWPVARAMPAMLDELRRQADSGFLHAEMGMGRTLILVQYWRSMDDLQRYAHSRDALHLPAWQRFNQASRAAHDDSVGIWHESYQVKRGASASIYLNMPQFGLARAAQAVRPVSGHSANATTLLRQAQIQAMKE